jgi:beta-lactamase regulating signal transducer with metallopeptidase domain
MNELLSSLSAWLVDFLALATALLAVVALALWRLKQPAQRLALAWGTMLGLTALAIATAVPDWPRWDLGEWLAVSNDTTSEQNVTLLPSAMPAAEPVEAAAPPALLPAVDLAQAIDSTKGPAGAWSWPIVLAVIWLGCCAAALGWILLGAVQALRLLWTAAKAPPWTHVELARIVGKGAKPRLKVSTHISSAVALGAVRPAILLPHEHVHEQNRAGVQAALAHEWAHIRHGDLWLLAWQRLLLPLLSVHPLFWILRRQIRADQELLADLAAAGEKPVEYAEALLAWAKQNGPRPSAGLAALAMWENPQTVSRRIQMILDPKIPVATNSSRKSRYALWLVLAALVAGLSVLSIRSRPLEGQDQPAAQQQAEATEPRVADLLQENDRLRKQILQLTAQLRRLRLLAEDQSSEKITDEEYIRRVYLDLTGVLPTPGDVKEFLNSGEANKRRTLLDKLLEDSKVADHWSRQWKDLIERRLDPAANANSDEAAAPVAEKDVTIVQLKHLTSERAVELAEEILDKEGHARIVAEPRTNSILIRGTRAQAAELVAIFSALDKTAAEPAARPARTDDGAALTPSYESGYDLATQRQLLEIDLEEARSELELARTELAENKNLEGTVPTRDLRKKEAAVRQFELRVKRIQIMLDSIAARQKPAATSPLRAIEEQIVLPKNLRERIWQTLGVVLEPMDDAAFKKLNSVFRGGLSVAEVRRGSPADERGIVKGDILVGLGRWEMRSLDNVAFVLANHDMQVAGQISFHVLRDGKVLVGRMPLAFSNTGDSPWRTLPPANAADPEAKARQAAEADMTLNIRLAELDLRQAKLKLEADEARLARLTKLAENGAVQQTELDEAKIAAAQSRLAVERAETVLQSLKRPDAPAEKRPR